MSLFDDLPDPEAENTFDNVKTESTQATAELDTTNGSHPPSASLPKPPPLLSLVWADLGKKGERLDMQDVHLCIGDLRDVVKQQKGLAVDYNRLSYFAVFDGHNGSRAAQFAAKYLHIYLLSSLPKGHSSQFDRGVRHAFLEAYKRTDDEFLKEARKQRPHWRDGSTAATLLLADNTLYVANIGDSRIVLARTSRQPDRQQQPHPDQSDQVAPKPSPICLTKDHNPVVYEERQRIQLAGGLVQNGRVGNALEVSRSFGDYQFKKQGVTCLPDVGKCQLTVDDCFILIACDGLWKSFSSEQAVAFVHDLVFKELGRRDQTKVDLTQSSMERLAHSICLQLVNEAVLRMSGDNISCILLLFTDWLASLLDTNESKVSSSYLKQDEGDDGPVGAKSRRLDDDVRE